METNFTFDCFVNILSFTMFKGPFGLNLFLLKLKTENTVAQ